MLEKLWLLPNLDFWPAKSKRSELKGFTLRLLKLAGLPRKLSENRNRSRDSNLGDRFMLLSLDFWWLWSIRDLLRKLLFWDFLEGENTEITWLRFLIELFIFCDKLCSAPKWSFEMSKAA
jgi:hypothetical protein